MTRVLVADGHPAMRLGIKGMLLATDVVVVGEACCGEEVLRLVGELRPDLVTLGLNLAGDADGIGVCRRLKELDDPPRVLVYTGYNLDEDVASCLLAGADSYLSKRTCCDDLLDAIRRTAAGGRVWKVGGRAGDPRSRLHHTAEGVKLTEKELQVAVLILRRYTNQQIADELYVSVPTVKTHVCHILDKFNLDNRWQLFGGIPKDG